MLILSRKRGERILIRAADKVIGLTVVEIDRGKVRLGVVADGDVKIYREEIWLGIAEEMERQAS